MEFIPPIQHELYKNLTSSAQATEGKVIGPFGDEDDWEFFSFQPVLLNTFFCYDIE